MSDPKTNEWVTRSFPIKGQPVPHTMWTVDDAGAFDEGKTPPLPIQVAPAIVMGELSLDCYHGCSPELHPAYMLAVKLAAKGTLDRWAFFVNRGPADEGFCSRNDHYAKVPREVTFFIPHPGAVIASVKRSVIGGSVSSRDALPKEPPKAWFDDGSDIRNPDNRRTLVKFDLVPNQGAFVRIQMPTNLGGDGNGVMKFVEGELVVAWNGESGPNLGGAATWDTETSTLSTFLIDPKSRQTLNALRRSNPAAVARAEKSVASARGAPARDPQWVPITVAGPDAIVALVDGARTPVTLPVVSPGPATTGTTHLRLPPLQGRAAAAAAAACRELGCQ